MLQGDLCLPRQLRSVPAAVLPPGSRAALREPLRSADLGVRRPRDHGPSHRGRLGRGNQVHCGGQKRGKQNEEQADVIFDRLFVRFAFIT